MIIIIRLFWPPCLCAVFLNLANKSIIIVRCGQTSEIICIFLCIFFKYYSFFMHKLSLKINVLPPRAADGVRRGLIMVRAFLPWFFVWFLVFYLLKSDCYLFFLRAKTVLIGCRLSGFYLRSLMLENKKSGDISRLSGFFLRAKTVLIRCRLSGFFLRSLMLENKKSGDISRLSPLFAFIWHKKTADVPRSLSF